MAEHIFPFLWLRGEERIKIENEIKAIYETGLRAFCVESRSHPDYCGKKWWDDLDAVFEMAQNWICAFGYLTMFVIPQDMPAIR